MIVVAGEWSDADLQFQAEHIVTSKLNNAGHNCIATQVLVLPAEWAQGDALLDRVRAVAARRCRRARRTTRGRPRRSAPPWPATSPSSCSGPATSAPSCPTFGRTAWRASSATRSSAVRWASSGSPAPTTRRVPARTRSNFANDVLPGTLGATDRDRPGDGEARRDALDAAVAGLRYGSVGINAWTGLNFLLGYTPWGAFPGHTARRHRQRHRVRAQRVPAPATCRRAWRWMPFRPLHRSALNGQLHMSPKPPFFVTNRTGETTARRLSAFLATGRPHGPAGHLRLGAARLTDVRRRGAQAAAREDDA